jgi:hypothetical protein
MSKIAAVTALGMLLCMPPPGRADFSFNVGNSNITSNPHVAAPYADLTITDSTTDHRLSAGQVKFALTPAGGSDAKFGALGFNLHGVSAGDFGLLPGSLTGAGGNASSWALGRGGNMSEFGTFDLEVAPSSNAAAKRLTSLTFVLQFRPGHEAEAVAGSFVALNRGADKPPDGWLFAAKYFPAEGGTGFIGTRSGGVASPGAVGMPEPSGIAMWGTAVLCGLGICLGIYWRMGWKVGGSATA